MNKKLFSLSYYFQYILVIFFLVKIYLGFAFDIQWLHPYEEFEISDWLINYNGGFVRRGLIGQVLWRIYQMHPFSVMNSILIMDILFFVMFLVIAFTICHKNNWSILPLIWPVALCGSSLVGYRRDFLMMLFAFIIFALFLKGMKENNIYRIILSICILSFSFLIYEPTFFFTVPVLFLLYFSQQKGTFLNKCLQSIYVFALPIITMGIVCFYKGNATQAETIWQSWHNMFLSYPTTENGIPPIGDGVAFLGNGRNAFTFHLNLIFCADTGLRRIVSNFLLFCSYPMIYYLVTRVPSINHKKQMVETNSNKILLSNFMLIQLVSMLPMFTILSCDLGRTIPYCIYTTFFLTHFVKKYNLDNPLPNLIDNISSRIQGRLDKYPICNNFWFYLLVIFLTPLRGCFGPKIRDNMLYKSYTFIKNLL